MELKIKNAVIHILNRESDTPLLNDFELDINDDIEVFLEKHISKSITGDEARKARFRDGRSIVREVCAGIVEDSSYFLGGSKEIASQLFKAMKTNSSISSTDLIVCLYETEDEKNVAILKMDYNTSFIHDVEMVDNRFKISIRKQDVSLPGVNQKIQKCAFVKSMNGYSGYDLIVLDNQINTKNSEEPIAQFFLSTFLDAELVADSSSCTKIFKKETENWIRNKIKEGELAVEEIREHVNNAIREDDEIDIETFSYNAFGNKLDLREDYISNLKDKGITEEKFNVDKDWVERKLNKIRLKTESNIEVVLEYEDFTNRDKFEIVNNPDGTRNIIIKNVTSIFEK